MFTEGSDISAEATHQHNVPSSSSGPLSCPLDANSVLPRDKQQETCEEIARLRNAMQQPCLAQCEKARLERLCKAKVSYLVAHNQRLVLLQARRMAKKCRHLDWEDLAQSGNMGLLQAIEHFDVERGVLFSTYAHWWVRAYIHKTINTEEAAIRVPCNALLTKRRISTVEDNFMRSEGRKPSTEELQDSLSREDQKKLKKLVNLDISRAASLDAPLNKTGADFTLLDVMTSDEPSAETLTIDLDRQVKILGLVAALPEKERSVLFSRFWEEKTLAEAGQSLPKKITRERARQLESQGLDRLRKACGVRL